MILYDETQPADTWSVITYIQADNQQFLFSMLRRVIPAGMSSLPNSRQNLQAHLANAPLSNQRCIYVMYIDCAKTSRQCARSNLHCEHVFRLGARAQYPCRLVKPAAWCRRLCPARQGLSC